jgi:hypothetical protein
MNQTLRLKLMLALTTAMDELLGKEIDPSWGLIHIPQELGFLMAQAALLVVDVVLATEGSMDEEGLLAVDENGVAL